MSGDFAVIGLGQFGRAVASGLLEQGEAVLAIDIDPERAKQLESTVDAVVVADASDERALEELALERMSCVVVAMGVRSKDTSIMVTALLRQRGIARIVARATSPLHARVLLAVGAHEIVNPEQEMGERLSRHLANPHVVDQFSLGPGLVVAEVEAPQSMVESTLGELDVRNRFGVTVVLIRRGTEVLTHAGADTAVASGDILVVLGPSDAVRRFAARS